MKIFRLLMYPANLVCDALGIVGEDERGVIRMLVNALILTTVGVIVVFVIST